MTTRLDDLVFVDDALCVSDSAGGRVYRVTTGVSRIGAGCAGTGGFAPELRADGGLALVGNAAFGLAVGNALGGSTAAVVFGLGADAAGLLLGGGCRIHLGLSLPIVALPPSVALSPGGPGAGRGVHPLPVPNDPALAGGRLFFQSVVIDPASGTGAFTLTNALGVTLLR
jgi:hypothetical protein